MRGISRRTMLGVLGCGTVAASLTAAGLSLTPTTSGRLLRSEIDLPDPFGVPLPVPTPIRPHRSTGTVDHYRLTQRPATVEILPGVKTGIWGYEGTFPGPLFDVRAGRAIRVRIGNELPVPTSTHLHGGITPPDSDGYPTDLLLPAGGDVQPHTGGHGGMDVSPEDWTFHEGAKTYEYPLEQRAATLWYHDHRMDFSAPQVWRGLAGMVVVRDDVDEALPLPGGERDVQLMICDRAFGADGELVYPALDPTLRGEPGVREEFMDGVTGDVNLVNGAPWPEHEVANTRYRLRLLNAANARRYRLALDPAPREGASFTQVGSDQGLLARPHDHESLTLAPAERRDVVVDFSSYPMDTTVGLVDTLAPQSRRAVMRFRVARKASDDSHIPRTLDRLERLTVADAVTTRRFDFRRTAPEGDSEGEGMLWTINGAPFDAGGSLAEPKLGTVERWRFTSDFHHPVHLHLAHFQVLSRNGRAPGAADFGWKDTVDVRPYETVDVLARFGGFTGRYMLHCHNLEHEDMAMMANFDVR